MTDQYHVIECVKKVSEIADKSVWYYQLEEDDHQVGIRTQLPICKQGVYDDDGVMCQVRGSYPSLEAAQDAIHDRWILTKRLTVWRQETYRIKRDRKTPRRKRK